MAPVCRCQMLVSRGTFTIGFSPGARDPDSEILVIITSLNHWLGRATVTSLTASGSF